MRASGGREKVRGAALFLAKKQWVTRVFKLPILRASCEINSKNQIFAPTKKMRNPPETMIQINK